MACLLQLLGDRVVNKDYHCRLPFCCDLLSHCLEPLLSTEGERLLLPLECPRHSIKLYIFLVDVHTYCNLIRELCPLHGLCECKGTLNVWLFWDEFVALVGYTPRTISGGCSIETKTEASNEWEGVTMLVLPSFGFGGHPHFLRAGLSTAGGGQYFWLAARFQQPWPCNTPSSQPFSSSFELTKLLCLCPCSLCSCQHHFYLFFSSWYSLTGALHPQLLN